MNVLPARKPRVSRSCVKVTAAANHFESTFTKPNLDHRIQPSTMTVLAQILLRTSNPDLEDIAKRLFFSASALNEPIATLQIVSEAVQNGTVAKPELINPLQRLSTLAKTDNNASAMILLAQILESQGKIDKAVTYYEQITNDKGKADRSAAEVEGTVAQAWLALGRIRSSNEDLQGAEAALKKAALEYDDPTAYFYLARFCDPKSNEYLLYNLKAASSGVREAAHNLGDFYLQQSKRDQQTSSVLKTKSEDTTSEPSETTSLQPVRSSEISQDLLPQKSQGLDLQEKRTLAREWFNIAAYAGFAPSQVNLALLLRADGSFDEGMTWLKHAERHPDFVVEVDRLKESWWKKDLDLT